MNSFATQRDQLIQTMLEQKRTEVFSEYLAATRRKMETAGDIKIYNEVLAKLDSKNETSTETLDENGIRTINY